MRSRRPDGRLPASGPAPFDGQLLFDLAVEAAEVLHRDGDLKSKLTWTTEAIRVATGASHVAYVELNGGTPMVRATAGTGKADARRIVGAGTGGLLDRVRRTRRPAQLPEFPHPDEAAVVALPVLGSDDRLHG
ncbi:MAG TPA: hypothetical protein VM618_06005, partial [Acidimicrobiia bacterium]|nr:hypothetical protein [Acidimicrobiia bacterium]